MRVLIISHGHPAFSIGGAEIASHNLFRALNATGQHEAFYLARTGTPVRRHAATPLMSLRQGEREVFLHADAWDPFWLSNGALDDLDGGFADYLRAVAPEVVHFHHVIGLGLEAIQQVRRVLPEAAIVITFHEYLAICLNHGQMVKTTRNALCRRASPADCASCFPQHAPGLIFQRERSIKEHLALADAYVSPSRFLIDRYVAWGLPAGKFRMIENGLDARPPAPPRALPPGGRRDRFGYFGQVSAFKGLDVLLEAVSRVSDAVWDRASLSVYGGNLERQPQEFRDRFGALMERVGRRARFFGSYAADELPGLMAQIDWTVVPSIWWENSPLVIQEALLHRRPPIVSNIGGMAEKVRDGVDGLQFRVASPEDLADRLADALTEPGLWARLSAAAPRPPDLAAFADEYLAVYGEALEGRRPKWQVAKAGSLRRKPIHA